MYTQKEKNHRKDFFSSVGEILIPEQLDVVEQTAAAELKKFVGENPLSGKGRLIIGRKVNSELIRMWCDSGDLEIHTVSEEDDGFQIKYIGDDIVIAGANPRGVLYGVYELEDRILEGKAREADTLVVPHFRKRSDGLGHYHNEQTFNFETDVIDDKKVEYLARLRVNQFCICCDGSPYGNHLSDFVKSDVFPFQRDPSPNAVSKLKAVSKLMAKYGIEYHAMLWEPGIPAKFASLDQYPPEVLGKVKRPWGGDENHMDTTLCISHPLVQEHYRQLIKKFVKEFPDVKGYFIYNMDGSSWLCTPDLCPRCKETLVDSDPAMHNPWENQAKFFSLICEAAHEADPHFKVTIWGPSHIYGDNVRKLYDHIKGFDCVLSGAMGGDHDIYVTMKDEPRDGMAETLKAAEKYNVSSYVYYAFNKLEAIHTGFPNPLNVAESIKTFKRWGISNLMEVTGPTPALNQINALAMKQFSSEPDTDVESWAQWLAEKQFGKEAGKLMCQVWEHTRDSYEVWNGFLNNPLQGSQFISRMGLMPNDNEISSGGGAKAIVPHVLDQFDYFYFEIGGAQNPDAIKGLDPLKSPEFIERFRAMEPHLAKAEEAAKAAVEVAGNERIGLSYYAGSFEGIERYTMKEYAKVNLAPIEIAHSMCKQKIHMLEAVALLRAMRDGDPAEKDSLNAEYLKLIEEEIELQYSFRALLERLAQERPTLALTGMCEGEIYTYIDLTDIRIGKVERYLAENK